MTSDHLRWLLRKRYKPPEFGIAFEVSESTGLEIERYLDAVAMNLYPSRGYSLMGFEIKIDRGDLRREIANPDKAEAVVKYLDLLYLVVPDELNILDIEVPLNWGIMVAKADMLRIKRPAAALNPLPLTREFLAALFRGMSKEDGYRSKMMFEEQDRQREATFEHRVQVAKDLVRDEHDERQEWVTKVIENLAQAGFKWHDLKWNSINFTRAVKFALTYRCFAVEHVEKVVQLAEDFAKDVKEQLANLEILKEEEENADATSQHD